jgi:hypothetical protein
MIFDAGGFDSDGNAPPTRCDISYISKVESLQKHMSKYSSNRYSHYRLRISRSCTWSGGVGGTFGVTVGTKIY